MADLLVRYTAPLPAGFTSGTLEIKRAATYVDAQGRKAQAYYRATIRSDRVLLDSQTGQALRIIAAGPGDPAAGELDWVETLNVSGLPTPLRQTARIPAVYTAPGEINLHQPDHNVRTVDAPNDAALAAQQAAAQAESAAQRTEQAANVLQQNYLVVLDQEPGEYITVRSADVGNLVGSVEVLTVGGKTYNIPVVDTTF